MEDRGAMLTNFEKIFGEKVEHEVIKMILQSTEWNAEVALRELANIADIEVTDLELNKNYRSTNSYSEVALQGTHNCNSIPVQQKIDQNKFRNKSSPSSVFNKTFHDEKLMILMRGLPGSGKTFFANKILKEYSSAGVVLSTDDYFYDLQGVYHFNRMLLHEAHQWNQHRTKSHMKNGTSPIIIDNTNLQLWEMEPYVNIALHHGYTTKLMEPDNTWKYDARLLSKKCIHGVPKNKIEEMSKRFEKDISIEIIISKLQGFSFGSERMLDRPKSKYDDDQDVVIESSSDSGSETQSSHSSAEDAVGDKVGKNNPNTLQLSHIATDCVVEEPHKPEDVQLCSQNDIEITTDLFTEISGALDSSVKLALKTGNVPHILLNVPNTSEEDHAMYSLLTMTEDRMGKDYVYNAMKDIQLQDPKESELNIRDSVEANYSSHKHDNREYIFPTSEPLNQLKFATDVNSISEELAKTASTKPSNMYSDQMKTVSVSINEIEYTEPAIKTACQVTKISEEVDSRESTEPVIECSNHVKITSKEHIRESMKVLEPSSQIKIYSDCLNKIEATGTEPTTVSAGQVNVASKELDNREPTESTSEYLNKLMSSDANQAELKSRELTEPSKRGLSLDQINIFSEEIDKRESIEKIRIYSEQVELSLEVTNSSEKLDGSILPEPMMVSSDVLEAVIPMEGLDRSETAVQHWKCSDQVEINSEESDRKYITDQAMKLLDQKADHSSEELDIRESIEPFMKPSDHKTSLDEHIIAESTKATVESLQQQEIDIISEELHRTKSTEQISGSSFQMENTSEINNFSEASRSDDEIEWESTCNDNCIEDWYSQNENMENNSVKSNEQRLLPKKNRNTGTGTHKAIVDNGLKILSHSYSDTDEEPDQEIAAWSSNITAPGLNSWEDNKTGATNLVQDFCHTGAIPKENNYNDHYITDEQLFFSDKYVDIETQTVGSDFIELNSESFSTNILYGDSSRFLSKSPTFVGDNEPLTKSKLMLHKSAMTEEYNYSYMQSNENSTKQLSTLKSIFGSIASHDLNEVLVQCNYDIDWAVNILIDSGYSMTKTPETILDSSDSCDEESHPEKDSESMIDRACSLPPCASEHTHKIATVNQNLPSSHSKCRKVVFKKLDIPYSDYKKTKAPIKKSFDGNSTAQIHNTVLKSLEVIESEDNDKSQNTAMKLLEVLENRSINDGLSSDDDSFSGTQYLTMEIDDSFASQLTNSFGPVSSLRLTSHFSDQDRRIILPLELCQQVYKFWAKTLEGNFKFETRILNKFVKDDEALARKLQEEEEALLLIDQAQSTSLMPPIADVPTNFKEIQDLEKAIERSNADNIVPSSSFSNILNLQKLNEEFSHIDHSVVEEAFVYNHSDYSSTKKYLSIEYGVQKQDHKTVIASEADEKIFKSSQQCSPPAASAEISNEFTVENPQDYRDEADIHYRARKENFDKAQEAANRGLTAVAAYYAQVGSQHTIKLKEANDRAKQLILDMVNFNVDENTIDLHLLLVPEAIQETQRFLSERKLHKNKNKISVLKLHIITGKGNHSIGGRPKLKPAIKFFLEKEKYSFCEMNPGMLQVTL